MFSALNIIILCWAIFLIYWLVSAFSVKPAQERAWSANRFRVIILGVAALIFLADKLGLFALVHLPSCQLTWRGCHYPLFSAGQSQISLLSVVLVVIGLVICLVARKTLSDNWSANIETKKGHELITKGIYGYMRHPIYSGLLLMSLGTLLALQTILAVLFFVIYFVFLMFKLVQEEKLLSRHFPKEYPAYKKRVKALIPYIL